MYEYFFEIILRNDIIQTLDINMRKVTLGLEAKDEQIFMNVHIRNSSDNDNDAHLQDV